MSINIWIALAVLVVALVVQRVYLQLSHKREIDRVWKKRLDNSRAALRGQAAERLAPMLQGFPYLPSDARFLGDPVDYVIFAGYADIRDNVGNPDDLEVVIIDIKRGRHARLNSVQQAIARAVEAKRVRFEVHRITDEGSLEVYEWRGGKLHPKKTKSVSKTRASKPARRLPRARVVPASSQGSAPAQAKARPSRSGFPWEPREVAYLERKLRQGAPYESLAATVNRTPEEIRAYFEKRRAAGEGE